MDRFERDGLLFDVRDEGPGDGTPVVLLHGFPGHAASWRLVEAALHDEGLRTLAPDQRGYSPGARPTDLHAYLLPELVADVVALADTAGLGTFHVVGHDWGGVVAWALGAWQPERVASLTVLSTPHPQALTGSLTRSAQAARSVYVAGFQLPVAPEALLLAGHGGVLRRLLRASGLSASWADEYVDAMLPRGALTAALAWYRALRLEPRVAVTVGPVAPPTRYVWSDGDVSLGPVAARATGRFVQGPYRFEVLTGLPHWLPEEAPLLVARHIVEQVASVAEPRSAAQSGTRSGGQRRGSAVGGSGGSSAGRTSSGAPRITPVDEGEVS